MMNPSKLSIAALVVDLQRALRALDLDAWALDKACREVFPDDTNDDPSSWRYQTNVDLARRRYNADLRRVRMLAERLFRTKQHGEDLEHHDQSTGVSERQVSLEQALKNRIAWRRIKRATIEGMIDTARGRIFETEAERAAHLAALHDDLDREELLIDELEALLVDPGLDKVPGNAYNVDTEEGL